MGIYEFLLPLAWRVLERVDEPVRVFGDIGEGAVLVETIIDAPKRHVDAGDADGLQELD